jgi:plasmid stabilization system protein ParE
VELEFSRAAREEISIAYNWYEEQQDGLGERFLKYLEAKADFVKNYPKSYPLKYKLFRLALLDNFPFLLAYELLEDKVIVYRVFHASRNPEYWRK